MAVQPLTRTPPVLLAPAAADDVLLLRRQLCSLQLALESRETAIDDFRSQTETILWSVGPQVSLFPQNLPCIAYLKDAAGRYIFVNQLWEKVHQKGLEGWYKKTDGELFAPDLAEKYRLNDLEVSRTGISSQTVDTLSNGQETTYWLVTTFPVDTVMGATGLIGGVAVDITARRIAEQSLRDTEERYRELFSSVLTGVYRATPEGKVLLANPAMIRMLGYESFEQLASVDLNDACQRSHSDSGFDQIVKRDGRVLDFEAIWRRCDGVEVPVRETVKAVRDSSGGVLYYEGVVEDLTETRRAQLLEKDRNRLLELVARNESLSSVFTELCLLVERQFPGRLCLAMLLRDQHLEMVAGPNVPITFAAALRPGLKLGPMGGPCGVAVLWGKPVIAADIEADPFWSDFRHFAAPHRLKSCWSVPILSGDRKALGTIAVYHTASMQPAGAELELLEMASRLAAIALEHRQLLADLEHQAKYDSLTALPNRFLFEDRLEAALETARDKTSRLGLLSIDLDRFKEINDTLGHRVGDVLLRKAAHRLSCCSGELDTLARMGGDEFALLLPEIETRSEAEDRADSILAALRKPFHVDGYELYVTASIGICAYPGDGFDSPTLQRNADRAMYRAKSRGRNNYHCYENELGAGALERLNLESDMRHALERNEFELFYQPQVDLNGKLKGFEALIRWNHSKHGLLYPGHFIAIAEESGLIVPIGAWVLNQACRQMAAWRHTSPNLRIAVNVSALQFYYADFVETVREALAEAQIEPSCLEIELTETLVMRNYEESVRQLERLRALGVSIAIDDFGTGYSCLSNLQRLPVNTLKIDKSFLTEIESSTNAAVVTAIAMLSRSLGLSVVAEGIERPEQLEVLKTIGVDLVQGYYLGRPLPADVTEDRFFNRCTS